MEIEEVLSRVLSGKEVQAQDSEKLCDIIRSLHLLCEQHGESRENIAEWVAMGADGP
jgi:hypothetical protein